jgi:hypothetical protein
LGLSFAKMLSARHWRLLRHTPAIVDGLFGIRWVAHDRPVCPGMIDTDLTRESASAEVLERLAESYPVPRLGAAIEVADLIASPRRIVPATSPARRSTAMAAIS